MIRQCVFPVEFMFMVARVLARNMCCVLRIVVKFIVSG